MYVCVCVCITHPLALLSNLLLLSSRVPSDALSCMGSSSYCSLATHFLFSLSLTCRPQLEKLIYSRTPADPDIEIPYISRLILRNNRDDCRLLVYEAAAADDELS